MAAPIMGEDNSNSASQCLAFLQALASKGQIFSFTLKVGSSFAFSLDTRENGSSTLSKKRKSPSTQRRNARRRAEFLAKKRGPPESESSAGKTTPEKVARPEKGRDFKCDQCDKDCCDCNHDHSCECYKSSKLTSFCDCEDVSGLRCRLR